MRRARTSSWERDAEGHRLSAVVATDKVFPYIGDRGCDPLRPVFIDGPGVAHGYDDGYRLCGHINMKRDYMRKDLGRTYKAVRKFPVMVLVKTLFTFISRGHKTLVFMPSTYDERTANGTRSHDLSALIDDTKLLRQIVQLELVQFVDEERNFPFTIRNLARRAYGVLITSDIIPRIDVFDKSVKRRNDDGSIPSRIVNASNMEDKSNSSCKTGSVYEDEQVSKWEGAAGQSVLEVGGRLTKKIMRTNNGTFVEELPIDFLPIVSLIYFNQNNERRILVPLDLPCFSGTFPTTDQVLVFPKRLDGDTAIAELARNSQLTLFKQCKLLEKLDILLDNQYPRGAKEKNVAELVKEAWLETGESDSDTDHLTKSSIRVIGNSLKSGNDNVATVNEREDEAMSEPSDLILFDDDFSDTVDERRHKHGETSSIDFDLVLFDDDFAAAHDLTELFIYTLFNLDNIIRRGNGHPKDRVIFVSYSTCSLLEFFGAVEIELGLSLRTIHLSIYETVSLFHHLLEGSKYSVQQINKINMLSSFTSDKGSVSFLRVFSFPKFLPAAPLEIWDCPSTNPLHCESVATERPTAF